ncbi:protein containing Prepilin-type cleavage/methylation [Rhodopirellula maiorica SM1]|uniref:Protein containing Prepilin-type cleavage/methylation n=1 Tax=Rhodopirellula maiorica SM1 TaxID=1265738 RepID=M5S2Z7_9BACT|nr:prepilin-type N-terminal cleavage/methylation domain-containing protein [Rhodopirellula maiorica]EMI20564.1 protein containing Prepilin-type cleavage/methylation [Rhodopirellula maiorica SM1]
MSSHNIPVRAARHGFTLVEILVVITIIGILTAIAIPAVNNAVKTARQSAIRMEVSSLETAIEKYREKYGDYPPDFSDPTVVSRHYGKLFPRMSTNDATLLANLMTGTTIDRAEALVWALGGYSEDIQRPFTGPGGPLVWTGDGTNSYTDTAVTDTNRQDPANFQINTDRVNAFYDFEANRFGINTPDSTSPLTGTNRYLSTDDSPQDLFPTYAARSGGAPFVYFDSRTYTSSTGGFNGYSSGFGTVRPYFSEEFNNNSSGADYATIDAALAAWKFMNPNKFQIISAGMDDSFGNTANTSGGQPVYFQYPTGAAMAPSTSVDTPGGLLISGVSRYQESSFGSNANAQADNITNFSNGTLVDDVP